MEWQYKLLHETRLHIQISHVAIKSCYNAPYSANLTSVEAPADRAEPSKSGTSSSSVIDGTARQIGSRNSAPYSNQLSPNNDLMQHTIFSQFTECSGASG